MCKKVNECSTESDVLEFGFCMFQLTTMQLRSYAYEQVVAGFLDLNKIAVYFVMAIQASSEVYINFKYFSAWLRGGSVG